MPKADVKNDVLGRIKNELLYDSPVIKLSSYPEAIAQESGFDGSQIHLAQDAHIDIVVVGDQAVISHDSKNRSVAEKIRHPGGFQKRTTQLESRLGMLVKGVGDVKRKRVEIPEAATSQNQF